MKKSFCLLLIFAHLGASPWAFGDVILTPPDINNDLKERLTRLEADTKHDQKVTGGALLVASGALVGTAMTSAVIGNDYTIGAAPGIFLALGGLFSLGGLFVLFRDPPLEAELTRYSEMPELKLDELADKVAYGQEILNQRSIISERERWWGGGFTILAGATNLLLGEFVMTNSGTPRESTQSAGYFFSLLGLGDLVFEQSLWSGGSMAALGVANLAAYHTDPHAPSSDFLFLSGGLVAASGIIRLFKPRLAEIEEEKFRNFLKNSSLALTKPEIFLWPTPAGTTVGLSAQFP